MGQNDGEPKAPRKRPFAGLGRKITETFFYVEEGDTSIETTGIAEESSDEPVSEAIANDPRVAQTAEEFYTHIARDLAAEPDALSEYEAATAKFADVVEDDPDMLHKIALKEIGTKGYTPKDVADAITARAKRVDNEVEEERVESLTAVSDRIEMARTEVSTFTREMTLRVTKIEKLNVELAELTQKKSAAEAEVVRGERAMQSIEHSLARAKDRILSELKRLHTQFTSN